MNFLQVKDWNEHQSYRRDRGQPPWIKLHRNLLLSPKWASLTDAEKGALVSIWMLAAERNGKVPDDPLMILKLCNLDVKPDLERFLSLQLLEKVGTRRRRALKSMTSQKQSRSREETPNAQARVNGHDGFAEFWAAYPKKVAKAAAQKWWAHNRPNEELREKILSGLRRVKDTPEWGKDRKQYIPHPATWLNGKRWDDENEDLFPRRHSI